MSALRVLRGYHAALVVLVLLAWLSGDWGRLHAWLGYGVAAVIVFRLLLALSLAPQLGLMRFYPVFEGLKLGNAATHPAISRSLLAAIAAVLIGTTATGIAIDRGRAIGLADAAIVARAQADDDRKAGARVRERKDNGPIEEVHEALADLLMLLVGLHVTYLLLFKRPLARFMLFLDTPMRTPASAGSASGNRGEDRAT